MPGSFFSHLECSVPCGAGPYDPRHVHGTCTCGAPLLARYDLTAAKRWTKTSLAGRDSSMWRYREIMPLLEGDKGVDVPITLGEGWTPLLRGRRLGKALGLDRVYIKDESVNPVGTVKARNLSAATTRAFHLGIRTVSIATTGPTGVAAAAYAAHADLHAHVFLSHDTRPVFQRESELFGATAVTADGFLDKTPAPADGDKKTDAAYDVSSFQEPYGLEGEKTIGYEIAEQLGWQLPDWIVYPTGSGTGLIGIWKAFAEMSALGWIDPVRRPHLVSVQAAGCAPIVRAFGSNAEKATAWTPPLTIADGLRVPETLGDVLVLRALRESAGVAMSVGDAEMVAGMRDLARTEGVSASPEGGAVLHALRLLVGEGRVKPHDTVVVVNTGNASKYFDLFTHQTTP